MQPVGVINTPWTTPEKMPIQPVGAKGVEGSVTVNPEFVAGLDGLEGFSHIWLIYRFHKSQGYQLTVKPFLINELKGVFATRAPRRPNPVGISVVRLLRIDYNILHISDVDILDGTPLLDIKPYVRYFDSVEHAQSGWLEETMHNAEKVKSDDRFK